MKDEDMPLQSRQLYLSPNGDRWLLTRDETGRVLVRHEPNRASGGTVTESEVGDFLSGPEKQELLRLIGGLIGSGERGPAT